MEVILEKTSRNWAAAARWSRSPPGYARNFLLPEAPGRGGHRSNKKIVEQERQAHLRKEAKLKRGRGSGQDHDRRDRHDRAEGRRERSALRLGDGKDVAEALTAQNFTIDRRKIQLDEPIKQLGEYKVPVRLHREVTAEVTVVVAKEE